MFPALTVLVAKKLLEIIGDVKRYLNEAIFKDFKPTSSKY